MQQINQVFVSKKIYVVCGAILLVVSLVMWYWISWTTKKFHEVFTEPMLLTECEPEEIIPQIEKTCGVEIPDAAEKILAAKNVGSWDDIRRNFILTFHIKTDQIASFVELLPGDIVKKEYRLEDDLRKTSHLEEPLWFLMPISNGLAIEGFEVFEEGGVIELMYIDTSNPIESAVYIKGSSIRKGNN